MASYGASRFKSEDQPHTKVTCLWSHRSIITQHPPDLYYYYLIMNFITYKISDTVHIF